jgi:hypothetical protein
MTYRPGNPTRTRELLTALAAPPGPEITTDWAGELSALTATIRAHTTGADHSTAALAYELVYHWRNELDRLFTAAEHQDSDLWARVRTPGTWLDSLLRLRVVLTHVLSKAYWSAHTEIRYADIEIERYLWGAR